MIKQIGVNNSISRKVSVICFLLDCSISQSELSVLYGIIQYCENMQLTITQNSREEIMKFCDITGSNLSTILHRLTEKGLIARQNKTIILNPMFKDLDKLTGVLVKFE